MLRRKERPIFCAFSIHLVCCIFYFIEISPEKTRKSFNLEDIHTQIFSSRLRIRWHDYARDGYGEVGIEQKYARGNKVTINNSVSDLFHNDQENNFF